MADEEITIRISTEVDDESLQSLRAQIEEMNGASIEPEIEIDEAAEKLQELQALEDEIQDRIINLDMNTDGADEKVSELNNLLLDVQNEQFFIDVDTGDAAEEIERIKTSLDELDGSGAQQTAEDVEGIGDAAANSSAELDDLTTVLGGITAIASGATLDAFATSASDAKLSTMGLSQALQLNESSATMDAVNAKVGEFAKRTTLGKGQIRSMWSQFGVGGVRSLDTLSTLTEDVTAFATITGKDISSVGQSLSRAFISTSPNRAFRTLGVSVQDVAQQAGMTEESFLKMWEAATPEERVGYFDEYIKKNYDVQEVNDKLANSYVTLKQNFDDTMGKMATAMGNIILPLITPPLQQISSALEWVANGISTIPGPFKTLLGIFIVGAGGLAILAGGFTALLGVFGKVNNAFSSFKGAMHLCENNKTSAVCFNSLSESIKARVNNIKQSFLRMKNSASSIFSSVISKVNSFKAAVTGALSSAGSKIGSFATTAGSKLKTLGTAFLDSGRQALTAAGNYVKSGIMAAGSAIKTGILTAATWLQTAAQTALNFVMSINPIFLIIMAIAALVAILAYLYFNNETVRNSINALGAGLMYVGQLIYGTLIAAWNNLVAKLTIVKTAIIGFVLGALNNLRQFPGRVWALLLQVITRVTSWGANLISKGRSTASSFVNTVVKFFTSLPGKIYNAISGVADKVKSVFANAGTAAWTAFVAALDSVSGGLATIAINAVTGSGGSPWEVTHNNNGGYAGSPFEETSQNNNNNQSGSKTGNTYVFKSLYMDKDFPNHVINVIDRRDELERMRTGV